MILEVRSPSSDSACVTRIWTLTPVHTGDDLFEMGCAASPRNSLPDSANPFLPHFIATSVGSRPLLFVGSANEVEKRARTCRLYTRSVHAGVAPERTDRVTRCHLLGPDSVDMSYDSVIVHTHCIWCWAVIFSSLEPDSGDRKILCFCRRTAFLTLRDIEKGQRCALTTVHT